MKRRDFLKGLGALLPAAIVGKGLLGQEKKEPEPEIAEREQMYNQAIQHMLYGQYGTATSTAYTPGPWGMG